MVKKDYNKLYLSLKYYLLGREYFVALRALNFARTYHQGTRKDGVTPEFQHQLEIALYLTTLKDIKNEETLLACALLHDVMEDYNVSLEELTKEFGADIARIVELLTKKFRGKNKDYPSYFFWIGKDPIASLVKGTDRINNVQTMVGVFTLEKQKSYATEVNEYFLPMLKRAKYNFPEQSFAYFNIIHMLKSQLELLEALHGK